jgi:hypothetical protein
VLNTVLSPVRGTAIFPVCVDVRRTGPPGSTTRAILLIRNVHTHPTLSEALQEAFHGPAGHDQLLTPRFGPRARRVTEAIGGSSPVSRADPPVLYLAHSGLL